MQIPADIDTDNKIDKISSKILTFLPYRRAIWIQKALPFQKRYLFIDRFGKRHLSISAGTWLGETRLGSGMTGKLGRESVGAWVVHGWCMGG